jgi:hypothetical protein
MVERDANLLPVFQALVVAPTLLVAQLSPFGCFQFRKASSLS